MAVPHRRLYRLSRSLVRIGVRLFYRRVSTHTLEHVPPRGPAIFAATHPNSITDPLVLGACVPREIQYVAHSGLFRKPLLGWLLPRCGVIPVHRPEDFAFPVDNSVLFRAAASALEAGAAIGIFPEGTSHTEERVRRLRTGTARIAFDAEATSSFTLGVQIVPVGLHFESPGRFRSDVLVLIGPPLVLHTFRRAFGEDPVQAVNELTAELRRRLERLVPEPAPPDVAPLVQRTSRLLRESGALDGGSPLAEHVSALRVTEALAWALRERPRIYAAYAHGLEDHTRGCRSLRLPEAALAAGPAGSPLPGWPVLLAAPLAVLGAAANALPYRATAWVTRHLHPDPTKVATVKFCAGVVLFLLWYAMAGAVTWALLSPAAGVAVAVALPLVGWVALRFLPAWQATPRPGRGVARMHAGPELERLRAQRLELAAAARELWDASEAARSAW